jgi:hypothetical protein
MEGGMEEVENDGRWKVEGEKGGDGRGEGVKLQPMIINTWERAS